MTFVIAGNVFGAAGNGKKATGTSRDVVLFNGKNYSNELWMWGWGSSIVDVLWGAGPDSNLNAIRWKTGDGGGSGITGMGFSVKDTVLAYDLSSMWSTESIKFQLKCDPDVGPTSLTIKLKSSLDGPNGVPEADYKGTSINLISDGQWHQYSIALNSLTLSQSGGLGFDNSKIIIIGLNTESGSLSGKEIDISDWWIGTPGSIAFPSVIFNGGSLSGNTLLFAHPTDADAAVVPQSAGIKGNTIQWTQENGKCGVGVNIDNPKFDFQFGDVWNLDSIRFKLKCDAGVGALRIQFESYMKSDTNKRATVAKVFTPKGDNTWNQYAFALKDMFPKDGTTGFDTANINAIQIMTDSSAVYNHTGIAGKVIYITDWWTGNPLPFDVYPPEAPTGVSATNTADYTNTINWNRVQGETNETYNIYFSHLPITDAELKNIINPSFEAARIGVVADNSTPMQYSHLIFSPNVDKSVTYYYAVVCVDAAGNASVVSSNSVPVTNTAKGVPTISLNPPVSFAADGNLSEWAGITPIIIKPSDNSGHPFFPTGSGGTSFSGNNDISAKVYLAVDNNYLYAAFDVTDNLVVSDPSVATYKNDCPDLYIGLYNQHGNPHYYYQHGYQPDYHFRFAKDRLLIDAVKDSILLPGTNYIWKVKPPLGYVVEARIPLADLASKLKDTLFVPVEGMRIPIDIAINDADVLGTRKGILTFSPYNEDLSFLYVNRWLNTWVANQNWDAVNDNNVNPISYSLKQNYPNPFNPSTKIDYSIEKAGFVSIRVFDILGREIANLVNDFKQQGKYSVSFDASKLASGMYLYKIESGSFVQVKKMMLVR